MQLNPFESIDYKVGIYQTVLEPYRLCVNIESSPNCEFTNVKLADRQYVYKKIWEFQGPRKAVYSTIMNKLFQAKIHPLGQDTQNNPNHKAIYDLPVEAYSDIDFLINTIITGLTIDPMSHESKFTTTINDINIDDALSTGLIYSFSKNPSAIIIQSGPPTRKNKPKHLNFETPSRPITYPSRNQSANFWKSSTQGGRADIKL